MERMMSIQKVKPWKIWLMNRPTEERKNIENLNNAGAPTCWNIWTSEKKNRLKEDLGNKGASFGKLRVAEKRSNGEDLDEKKRQQKTEQFRSRPLSDERRKLQNHEHLRRRATFGRRLRANRATKERPLKEDLGNVEEEHRLRRADHFERVEKRAAQRTMWPLKERRRRSGASEERIWRPEQCRRQEMEQIWDNWEEEECGRNGQRRRGPSSATRSGSKDGHSSSVKEDLVIAGVLIWKKKLGQLGEAVKKFLSL